MRANSFAAPVVKIQAERGHRVITDGPYAIVRHPMYAGALLLIVGMPLLLGSWWGLALAPIIVLLLAVRAVLEERTLDARSCRATRTYAARVRYRHGSADLVGARLDQPDHRHVPPVVRLLAQT